MKITKNITPHNKNGPEHRKPIDLIVIHWFGIGTLTSALNRFHKKGSGGSAHYLVSDGKIVQAVEEDHVAWHANNWPANQRSIGIEHDATAQSDANPHDLSEKDYKASAELIADIAKRYSIPLDRDHVKKHSDFSPTQCCGTVDVNKLIRLAKEHGEDPCSERVKELEEVADGLRDSRNSWRTESKKQKITIAELEAEIDNREEQVERVEKVLEMYTSLDGKPLEKELLEMIDEFAKDKGRLNVEIARLKEEINQLNQAPREVTWREAWAAIFSILFGKKNGTTTDEIS